MKIRPLLKRVWMAMVIMLCSVVYAQAANITYSLTTHVDGRTITESKALQEGAALETNMPQKFWRAFCTYTFYADEDMTEEITEAPAEDATVYVDYVFNPPFVLSDDNSTVYYELNGVKANGDDYCVYVDGNSVKADKAGDYTKLDDPATGEWAYYGDAYSLNLKNKAAEKYLHDANTPIVSDALVPGWQLHLTDVQDHYAFVLPEENDALSKNSKTLGFSNMGGGTHITTVGGDLHSGWTDQGVLTGQKDNWGVFTSVLAEEIEPEIVIERTLTKDRWITLVLPYNVQDVNNIGGIKGEALEYNDLDVEWVGDYVCNATLHFTTADKMWAGYPYLFRAVEFPDGGESGRLTVYSGPRSEAPTDNDIVTRTIVTNGVSVLMKGTFDGFTLDVANYEEPWGYDYIYFYFGYDPQAQVPYNFYVVDNGTVRINPSLCYFKIEDELMQPWAKGVNLFFDQETTGINNVKNVVEKSDNKVYNLNGQQVSGNLNKGIYIVNGKKVLVK